MWMVWVFVFVSTLIWLIEGASSDELHQARPAAVTCDYDINGIPLPLEEYQHHINYDTCQHCICKAGGNLSCQSIGYDPNDNDNEMGVSSDCEVIRLPRCGFEIVRKDDHSVPCNR